MRSRDKARNAENSQTFHQYLKHDFQIAPDYFAERALGDQVKIMGIKLF